LSERTGAAVEGVCCDMCACVREDDEDEIKTSFGCTSRQQGAVLGRSN
jgi:hypothetical protein